MSFFSPQILIENIKLIGEIISVLILLVFDDFFTNRVAFGGTDKLKTLILEKAKEKFKRKHRAVIKYIFEFMATIIFIAYFVAGYWVLSEYIVTPALIRMQSIILLWVVSLFMVMSWMLNNRKVRKEYLGYK
jgi:hypothetical protein